MTGTYALIKGGVVVNTILWEGPDSSPMEFPEGVSYEEFPDDDGNVPSTGWLFSDGVFSAPPMTEDEAQAIKEQKIASNISTKDSLIASATQKIVPSQTKLLLGRTLTDAETSELNGWLNYIDKVSAIDANTDEDLDWPTIP